MERWLQGDATAFEALVRRWQQPIARVLGRLLGGSDQVPDLCQEVFLKVYRARPRYRENGAFAGWIYRVTLNVARSAARRHRPVLPLRGHQPADAHGPADAVCRQREEAELVARAVAELPEPLREVLVLRHYEGLKFEEIARLSGTPASTLKSRFAAALNRLKTRLLETGLNPEELIP
jgi:RNA polymerase sigma-70 factor (ECF subfamily)